MGALTLQAIFSTLFRIFIFIYLRIIPARVGVKLIPTLFLAYAVPWTIDLLRPSTPVDVLIEEDDVVEVKPTNGDVSSEVEITETKTTAIVVSPSPPAASPLNTVLFSLSTTNTALKLFSFLINLTLLGFFVDFLYRPTFNAHDDLIFTRVGAVYSDSVKVQVRYPNLEAEGIRLVWKQLGSTLTGSESGLGQEGWTDGPLVSLIEENDWVGVVKLDNLWASTYYQYRLAFTNGTLSNYPSTPITFKTFPDPRIPGTRFKFVASSCILPNYPYVPFTAETRIKGFGLLARQLASNSKVSPIATTHATSSSPTVSHQDETAQSSAIGITDSVIDTASTALTTIPSPGPTPSPSSVLDEAEAVLSSASSAAVTASQDALNTATPSIPTEFIIILGDFIYADIPRYVSGSQEAYRKAYRRVYESAEFRKVYEQIPIFNIYDDHEIKNNYNGYSNDSTPPFQNASSAWGTYQGSANYESKTLDANGQAPHYFDFVYGDVAFFVLDTRRYRAVTGVNETEGEVPTLLGDKQMSDFQTWLVKTNSTATFKFIISSVPLTAMWGGIDGQTDTWVGAEAERRTFLDLIQYVPNVIVISGDRHEFAAVEHLVANPIVEFSISPLSQFYVPYVRTFWSQNARTKAVTQLVNETLEDGNVTLKEVVEHIPEEKILKYLPHGNYKWGTFEVDTTDPEAPTVTLELTVDGSKAWEYTIVGKPVRYLGTTALGSQLVGTLGEGLKGVLQSLGRLGKIFG